MCFERHKTGFIGLDIGRLNSHGFRAAMWVVVGKPNRPGKCDDEEGEDDSNDVDKKSGAKA